MNRLSKGFTLLEVLVVVAIIAVLTAIILPAVASAKNSALMIKEVSAARQIMSAYGSYTSSHDGQLLLGYDKTRDSVSISSVGTVAGIMCARYPWRLAEYVGGQMDDIFLINATRKQTNSLPQDGFQYQYLASLYPALGINAYCIGGYEDGSGSGNFSTDVVRSLGAASHASSLIVFASARYTEGNSQATPGFHLVTPPRFWRTNWTTPFDARKPASAFGNVDLRWDGKATCAFLDGHVAMLGEKELLDMRRWSGTAAENNDPTYVVPR